MILSILGYCMLTIGKWKTLTKQSPCISLPKTYRLIVLCMDRFSYKGKLKVHPGPNFRFIKCIIPNLVCLSKG